jgi:KUP system potassium uptake protein
MTKLNPLKETAARNYILALIALGIVFGDIGTSPLYAFRECFSNKYGLAVVHENILGILSLIFWSLIIVISLKYTVYVMRADNEGEGGVLALLALLISRNGMAKRFGRIVFSLGVFGAALFYGDAMLTPAISVLSAVEGLRIASPVFHDYVVPVTLVILACLFFVQSKGTGRVGSLFGPVMLVWFFTLSVLGVLWIIKRPEVLVALNPLHAAGFFIANKMHVFFALGAVFLVVTGGEALYADMGHFGGFPIRLAWYALVLPALVLNYFGQGALLLARPEAVENSFYLLAPPWGLYPLIILATMATIIASQAVISGAFSLTSQALQFDFLPRVKVIYTSPEQMGQIYIPFVNWLMFMGTVFLVLVFRSSGNLASAYGAAIVTLMVITTLLMYVCSVSIWKWNTFLALTVTVCLLIVDLAFFGANITKLGQGAWFPYLIAIVVYLTVITWTRGRRALAEEFQKGGISFDLFLADPSLKSVPRVPGTAVYMSKNPEGVPRTLLHNFKHNKVFHERVIILTIYTEGVPRVPWPKKFRVEKLDHGFIRVIANYGFMETPDISHVVRHLKDHGIDCSVEEITFFLGRETIIVQDPRGLSGLRKQLFAFLSQNMLPATSHFNVPPNRVVEIGLRIQI